MAGVSILIALLFGKCRTIGQGVELHKMKVIGKDGIVNTILDTHYFLYSVTVPSKTGNLNLNGDRAMFQ